MEKERIAVKLGSNCVADENGIRQDVLNDQAAQLGELGDDYVVAAVITSGAIAVGKRIWEANGGVVTDGLATTYSTIGQGALTMAWTEAFRQQGVLTGQVLVTHHDITEAEQGLEGNILAETLAKNIGSGVINLVNENDALSDIEIMKLKTGGDNDGLAAHIAQLVKADHLILLTDGADGVEDADKQVIGTLDNSNIIGVLADLQGVEVSDNSRGGIYSKVQAAFELTNLSGISAHIAGTGSSLRAVLAGQAGTNIWAERSKIKAELRK